MKLLGKPFCLSAGLAAGAVTGFAAGAVTGFAVSFVSLYLIADVLDRKIIARRRRRA